MESIKLEHGWLARQMKEVREEVRGWPEVLKPLRTLNASLVHCSNRSVLPDEHEKNRTETSETNK
jgi:hypothetical protein